MHRFLLKYIFLSFERNFEVRDGHIKIYFTNKMIGFWITQFQVTFNSNPNQEERMIKVEPRKERKDQEMDGGKRKQAQGKRHLKKQRERGKRYTIAVH